MKPAASAPAILLLVAAFAIAGCGDSNKYAAPPPPKVTVATPAERDITSYFDATGNTAAVNSVDLVARVQGFIQEISYTDGDFVKKDTLLFTIEPEPYRLKLLAAQAAEAGSQATLKQAERYVLVVNADNVVEQRRVETGQLVGDLRVIESGLHKEDRAVVGGIMRAIPGRKVEPELRAAAAN